jgi:hypothetical protein
MQPVIAQVWLCQTSNNRNHGAAHDEHPDRRIGNHFEVILSRKLSLQPGERVGDKSSWDFDEDYFRVSILAGLDDGFQTFACRRSPIASQKIVPTEFHDYRLRPTFQNVREMLRHVPRRDASPTPVQYGYSY